jgi:hypothetical protein
MFAPGLSPVGPDPFPFLNGGQTTMTPRPNDPHQAPEDPVETDERFPSGPWKGFYQQFGKHQMDLDLTFRQGRILGHGRDGVGRFLIRGGYDVQSGKCSFSKRYLGAHDVSYQGYNEGKGIWGVWDLIRYGDRGGFHIWPAAWGDMSVERLEEEADEPVSAVTTEVVESELFISVP